MERVVYILGAGFSAPLGLPVMSNFIMKAKDLYFSNQDKYSYFSQVFDLLEKMAVIKNYFATDLYNIEEVLSILEMNDYLNGSNNSHVFKSFISDVISFYTPTISEYGNLPSNWNSYIFGKNNIHNNYGYFISKLLGVKVSGIMDGKAVWKADQAETNYSIISFNYDMILENFVGFMRATGHHQDNFGFNTDDWKMDYRYTILSKLHGSVDKNNIIPPTWNKYSNKDLLLTWQNAWKSLTHANHIRILGYSLPVSDSYIRYFLKSSLFGSKHLKSIDIITLDNNNDIKSRYGEFIDFNYYRFKNANILDYFQKIKDWTVNGQDSIETSHNSYMTY